MKGNIMKNILNMLTVALVALSVIACSEKKADDSSMKKEQPKEEMMTMQQSMK